MLSAKEYSIEHLVRKDSGKNVYWVHAEKPVDDKVDVEQILTKENGKGLLLQDSGTLVEQTNSV